MNMYRVLGTVYPYRYNRQEESEEGRGEGGERERRIGQRVIVLATETRWPIWGCGETGKRSGLLKPPSCRICGFEPRRPQFHVLAGLVLVREVLAEFAPREGRHFHGLSLHKPNGCVKGRITKKKGSRHCCLLPR